MAGWDFSCCWPRPYGQDPMTKTLWPHACLLAHCLSGSRVLSLSGAFVDAAHYLAGRSAGSLARWLTGWAGQDVRNGSHFKTFEPRKTDCKTDCNKTINRWRKPITLIISEKMTSGKTQILKHHINRHTNCNRNYGYGYWQGPTV